MGYLPLIELSMKAGVTPTTIILGGKREWTKEDALILNAYQVVQNEKCQHCGYPRWLCRNEDPRLQVRVKTDDCYATSEIDAHREGLKDDAKGAALYAEFYTVDDSDLLDFRDLYEKQLEAEREGAADG